MSDLYTIKEECSLELEAVMLNVNSGHNKELMKMSHTLWEYAEYTARVRKYAEEMKLEDAVERAIEECIRDGILKEFLEKNRAEAKCYRAHYNKLIFHFSGKIKEVLA